MDRERAAVIEIFSKGKSQGEILKLLQIPKSRGKFVYRTIQRYNKTGSVKDMPRSGRAKSVTTPRLKDIVRDRIRRNPRRFVLKMASLGTMQNLVKNDLHLRSYKRRTIHFLSEKIKEKRLARSKGLLTRLATQQLDNIIFSDYKIFTIVSLYQSDSETTLSDRMGWNLSKGRTPLIFVPATSNDNKNIITLTIYIKELL